MHETCKGVNCPETGLGTPEQPFVSKTNVFPATGHFSQWYHTFKFIWTISTEMSGFRKLTPECNYLAPIILIYLRPILVFNTHTTVIRTRRRLTTSSKPETLESHSYADSKNLLRRQDAIKWRSIRRATQVAAEGEKSEGTASPVVRSPKGRAVEGVVVHVGHPWHHGAHGRVRMVVSWQRVHVMMWVLMCRRRCCSRCRHRCRMKMSSRRHRGQGVWSAAASHQGARPRCHRSCHCTVRIAGSAANRHRATTGSRWLPTGPHTHTTHQKRRLQGFEPSTTNGNLPLENTNTPCRGRQLTLLPKPPHPQPRSLGTKLHVAHTVTWWHLSQLFLFTATSPPREITRCGTSSNRHKGKSTRQHHTYHTVTRKGGWGTERQAGRAAGQAAQPPLNMAWLPHVVVRSYGFHQLKMYSYAFEAQDAFCCLLRLCHQM